VARRPESVTLEHDNLTVIGGDVLAPGAWANRLTGVDAVISALGVGTERTPTMVYSAGTANILAAMKRSGIRRLAVVSGAPAGDWQEDGGFKRLVLYPILHASTVAVTTICDGWNESLLKVMSIGPSYALRTSPTAPRQGAIASGWMGRSSALSASAAPIWPPLSSTRLRTRN
jgi:hypothetical protein